ASAVAEAAIRTGVAQQILDIAAYREQLERRMGKALEVMRVVINKAQRQPRRIVFPEGEEDKILRASQILIDEKIACPILLGNEAVIRERMAALRVHPNSWGTSVPAARREPSPSPDRLSIFGTPKAVPGL